MPETISVDITEVRIGQSIKVKDISIENVELLDNANAVIMAVKTSRVAVAEEEEEGPGVTAALDAERSNEEAEAAVEE